MLIPEILKRGGIESLAVEGCRTGPTYHVEHFLKLPSGHSVHFTGHPDFALIEQMRLASCKRKLL